MENFIGYADGSNLEPMVRKLEYWQSFTPEDRAALLALPHRIRTFEQHHYIVREFDKPAFSCVLLSGFAVRHKIVTQGRRQILAIHMRGELVDLQNSFLRQADHNVQMLTPGKAAMIPREEIERIAFERPTVGKALWTDTLVEGSIAREWIANVGRRDARTRLAHLLCEFSLRMKVAGLGQHVRYELPMTQDQLADATGLTSVHINRTLKGLEADGLIERPNPRAIEIGDWRQLAKAADFNSGYLHLNLADPELALAS